MQFCLSTPLNDLNLNVINFFSNRYKFAKIGFSDHSIGLEAGIVAAAIGARIIEKHFTINKKLSGPDHKISLDPKQLSLFVKCVNNTSKMLGNYQKKITASEKVNIIPARKSIYASKILEREKFSKLNLTVKAAKRNKSFILEKVVNQKSKYNFKKSVNKIKKISVITIQSDYGLLKWLILFLQKDKNIKSNLIVTQLFI